MDLKINYTFAAGIFSPDAIRVLKTFELKRLVYLFREWLYSQLLLKRFSAFIVSIVYIILLMWFTHVDVIIDCFINNVVEFSAIIQKIVVKQAHFVSFITNWGILLMLFLDLFFTNRCKEAVTLINIIGILAIILIFWCAVGCKPDTENIKETLGALAFSKGCIFSLGMFILTSLCLKYIALKP